MRYLASVLSEQDRIPHQTLCHVHEHVYTSEGSEPESSALTALHIHIQKYKQI